MPVKILLPVRQGSQRVRNKNIQSFNGLDLSLLTIKLKQLDELLFNGVVDEIIVSTDCQTTALEVTSNFSKFTLDQRPSALCQSDTRLSELIKYFGGFVNVNDTVLWTHVTSPFFGTREYTMALKSYFNKGGLNDSLVSVRRIQNFIFEDSRALNFTPGKWARTQDLVPYYEITNACFICSGYNYVKYGARLGDTPKLFESSILSSLDVDEMEDFRLVERLVQNGFLEN